LCQCVNSLVINGLDRCKSTLVRNPHLTTQCVGGVAWLSNWVTPPWHICCTIFSDVTYSKDKMNELKDSTIPFNKQGKRRETGLESILQILANDEVVKDLVHQHGNSVLKDHSLLVGSSLLAVFSMLWTDQLNSNYIDYFKSAFFSSNTNLKKMGQNDPARVLCAILNDLELDPKMSAISALFDGSLRLIEKCPGLCDLGVKRPTKFPVIELHCPRKTSLQSAVNLYFEPLTQSSPCKTCGSAATWQHTEIVREPKKIAIKIQRFTKKGKKRPAKAVPVTFHTQLNVEGTIYELAAVVEHVDGETIVTGKFITFVTNYPSYLRYDLSEVTRVGIASVLDASPYILVYSRLADDDVPSDTVRENVWDSPRNVHSRSDSPKYGSHAEVLQKEHMCNDDLDDAVKINGTVEYEDSQETDVGINDSPHLHGQDFGPKDSPAVPGRSLLCPSVENVMEVVGKNMGIQGHKNSCYLDATLFSMFCFTSVFNNLLDRPREEKDMTIYDEVQRVLREEIVNPLRKGLFVRADKVVYLRTLLDSWSDVEGLKDKEKDPEELLTALMQVLKVEPFLELTSGETAHHFQLFVDRDDNLLIPTVQDLLEQSFSLGRVKLMKPPTVLILHMPRFGNQFKVYDRIFPNALLDITTTIASSPMKCVICGALAEWECPSCYGTFDRGLAGTAFCSLCLNRTHKMKDSHNVEPREKSCKDLEDTTRIIMELVAVVCIKTSHYVSYVRCGSKIGAPWCLFDSMADRIGELNGYNMPEISPAPEVEKILSDVGIRELNKNPSMVFADKAERLVRDAYMCIYQRKIGNEQAYISEPLGKFPTTSGAVEISMTTTENKTESTNTIESVSRSTTTEAEGTCISTSGTVTTKSTTTGAVTGTTTTGSVTKSSSTTGAVETTTTGAVKEITSMTGSVTKTSSSKPLSKIPPSTGAVGISTTTTENETESTITIESVSRSTTTEAEGSCIPTSGTVTTKSTTTGAVTGSVTKSSSITGAVETTTTGATTSSEFMSTKHWTRKRKRTGDYRLFRKFISQNPEGSLKEFKKFKRNKVRKVGSG